MAARALAAAALLCATAPLAVAAPRPWANDTLLTLLADRLLSYQIVASPQDVSGVEALVAVALATLDRSNFTFHDVDYAGENPAFWSAINHTARVRAMGSAVASPASRYFNDSDLRATASSVLNWWLVNRFVEGVAGA